MKGLNVFTILNVMHQKKIRELVEITIIRLASVNASVATVEMSGQKRSDRFVNSQWMKFRLDTGQVLIYRLYSPCERWKRM